MSKDYLTSPWQNKQNQTVLQELRRQGYSVEESNGKATIKVGDKTYEVDLTKPIWTIMAEIGNIEAENKRTEIRNDAKNRAEKYHSEYEKCMEEVQATKKRRNVFLKLWHGARTLYNKILGKNNAQTVEDIKDDKDKKLAVQYSDDATTNKFAWLRAGNDIQTECDKALNCALREGNWNTLALV